MKEEEKDNYQKAFSTVITIFGGTAATALTGEPFSGMVLGNFLTEMLTMQSQVKQDRVFKFFELLERDLKILTDSYDLSKIDKVTIWDLVELAMVKASKSNNEERIKRLKNIIKNQMIEPTEFDYVERFLNLAGTLTDTQVVILKVFVDTQAKVDIHHQQFDELRDRLTEFDFEDEESNKKFEPLRNDLKKFIGKISGWADTFNDFMPLLNKSLRTKRNSEFDKRRSAMSLFSNEESNFMKAELVSMGLIYNPSSGKMSDSGDFAYYRPTGLAIKFIEYLKD